MAYIKDQDILDATDGGLEIILYYYPDAQKIIHKGAKQFRIRLNEKTASASLKKLPNGTWVVTDFGGDQKSRNGIQVCQLEEGISYAEACNLLGARYQIKGAEMVHYKPEIEKRPLKEGESKGEYDFEPKEFTDEELAILGPRINAVYCKEYRLVSLASFTFCKENEAVITRATPNYPIFMFDFGTWQKIYQPNSAEKQYRFRYAGTKPDRFMFGIDIIEKEFKKRKKKIENDYGIDEDEEDDEAAKKNKRDPRLDVVFICSGGSDGLNLRSFEKYPVWFNSESEHLNWDEYRQLKKLAKEICYVGDLDHTGVKQAISLGLKYMDIKLLWLPDSLKQYRDKRGNPRKDFKDFVDVFYRHEQKTMTFQNSLNKLIENALPMQFWTETWKKDGPVYSISNTRLYHFLELLGFGRYESPTLKEGYIYIRKDGNIVRILEPHQIAGFVNQFLEERGMSPDLRDYAYRSSQLTEKSFSNLRAKKIEFSSATRDTQYMFFTKKIMKITAEEIVLLPHGSIENYIWEDKVIDFHIRPSDPHFEIRIDKDGDMDIKIHKKDNMFFNFLINASRIHWKEELEDCFDKDSKGADEYFREHKFNIAGPNLEPDKQLEQKLHLINKIYSIGYMLHTYKNYSKPWAVFAMDNKLSELGESHGGSGKSLAYSFLNKIIKRRHYLEGRNSKLTMNEFIYSGVTEDTDYVMVDDASQYIDFDFFFSQITGSMKVNPKNKDPYEIPFEKSPKFCFTSNFTIRNMDPSKFRRLLFTVFSDYYHSSAGDDGYKQARKVSDDFGGRELFTDFTESDYNDFYNFCAQCVQFFLSYDFKINPPMDNVTKRNLQSEMGEAFMGWAEAFFESRDIYDNYVYRDQFFSRDVAFEEMVKGTKLKWTANKFKKAMRAFCQWNNWVLNPEEFQGKDSRIIKKIDGKTQEAFYISTKVQQEMDNVHVALQDDEETESGEVKTVFDQE